MGRLSERWIDPFQRTHVLPIFHAAQETSCLDLVSFCKDWLEWSGTMLDLKTRLAASDKEGRSTRSSAHVLGMIAQAIPHEIDLRNVCCGREII